MLNESSAPESSCPGPAQFTCRGTETAIILYWTLNGVRISTYNYDIAHEFPRNLTLMNTSLPIEIQVVNASQVELSINITSTLSVSNVLFLNGSSLQCQDGLGRESNEIHIIIKGMLYKRNQHQVFPRLQLFQRAWLHMCKFSAIIALCAVRCFVGMTLKLTTNKQPHIRKPDIINTMPVCVMDTYKQVP